MERKELEAQRKALEQAKKQADTVLKDGLKRADVACKEAKKQADIVYKEAKKIALDKESKEVADKAHKEALQEAEKVRDAIKNEVWAVWHASYEKRAEDLAKAIAASEEAQK